MSSTLDVLSFLRQHSVRQAISVNTWLFRQGDPLREIYLLEKGVIKLTRLEANGHEVIVELRFPGSLLSAASALANAPAPLTAITITECEVARLSVKDFLQLEQTDTAFSHGLLVFISQQKGEQTILQSNQKAFPARTRLARLLLLLLGELGVERNGEMRLDSPLSRQGMAQWVGVEPPTLSAILGEMKRDGLIAVVKGWIIFCDLERLRYEAEIGVKTSRSPRSSQEGKSKL